MKPQSKKNLIYVAILLVIIGVGIGIYFFVTNKNKEKSCNSNNKLICKMGSTAKCDNSTGYDWKCVDNCQGQHKTCTNTGDFVVCENNELKCVPFQKCNPHPFPKCKLGQLPKCNGLQQNAQLTCAEISETCQSPIDLPYNKQCTNMTKEDDCLIANCIWVRNLKGGGCNSKLNSNYTTNQWSCMGHYDPQSCSKDNDCVWNNDY